MAAQTIESLSASLAVVHTAIASMQSELRKQGIRVTALEGKQPTVPPVVTQPPATGKTESADLTMVPPSASIVDSWLRTLTIAGGKAVIDGVPVAETSGVVLLKKIDHPVTTAPKGVYQQTDTGDWYGPFTPTSLGTHVAGDPSAAAPPATTVPPVVSSGAPAVASAVGYNTRTFGPDITMNQNWFLFDHYGPQNAGCVTQLPNGAVRCNGGGTNGFNAHICSARTASGAPGWRGVSFGGGAYFEATLSWDNAYRQVSGWPSWWGNECNREAYGNRQWPGQSAGYKDAIEMDFMEWWSDTNFGAAMHRWYENSQDKVEGASIETPSRFGNGSHRYGYLWVPSTPSSNGYGRIYLDGVMKKEFTWPRYNPNSRPPPGDISCMDVTHQCLILGTSAGNPMTVTKVEVWQRDTNSNIVIA